MRALSIVALFLFLSIAVAQRVNGSDETAEVFPPNKVTRQCAVYVPPTSLSCDGCEVPINWIMPFPPEQTIEYLSTLIHNNPSDPILYRDRGIARWIAGKQDFAAIKDFTESLRLNHRQPDVYTFRGVLRLCNTQDDNKNYDWAADDFDLALRLDPQMARTYYFRATAMQKKWGDTFQKRQSALVNANVDKKKADSDSQEKRAKLEAAQGVANILSDGATQTKTESDAANMVLTRAYANLAAANSAVNYAIAHGNNPHLDQLNLVLDRANSAVNNAKASAEKANRKMISAKAKLDAANTALTKAKSEVDAQTNKKNPDDNVAAAEKDLKAGIRELDEAIRDFQEAISLDPSLTTSATCGRESAKVQKACIEQLIQALKCSSQGCGDGAASISGTSGDL